MAVVVDALKTLAAGPGLQLAPAAMPMPEAVAAGVGTSGYAADALHTHPAVSSRQRKRTNATGVATFMYSRRFAATAPPVILRDVVNDTGRAIDLQVLDILDPVTGEFIGATVTARRGQLLPQTLLTLAPLTGFDIFAGPLAANVEIVLAAIEPTVFT